MRTRLAAVLMLAAFVAACGSGGSDSPSPQGTPSDGSGAQQPPVGYVLTGSQWHRMHSVNCHQPGGATYGF